MKLKKGPWTREEDQKLLAYIEKHGHGSWRILPAKAGLQRCGKSCRLRWTNYLRPDIKRGKLSSQEEKTIIRLHALLGNRWSAIATHLPKRTDNEIKNYWNTRLKKRLTRMGIDPTTHKPKNNPGGSLPSKDVANLSHMAQWETARLEAEARLVRESKFMSKLQLLQRTTAPPPPKAELPCLDIFKVWQSTASWAASKPMKHISTASTATAPSSFFGSATGNLESPTSTLNFPSLGFNNSSFTETVVDIEKPGACGGVGSSKLNYYTQVEGNLENSFQLQDNNIEYPLDYDYNIPGLTDLISINYNSDGCSVTSCVDGNFEDDKNYWNDLLNLVSSPPMESPIF